MSAAPSMATMLRPRPSDRPPREALWGWGAIGSLGAHAVLVSALAWSVHWHADEPAGVEAELWAAVPEAIAPPPAPVPEPVPAPAPAPVAAPRPEPVAVATEAPPRRPDIVTEALPKKPPPLPPRNEQAERERLKADKLKADQAERQRAEEHRKADELKLQKLREQNLQRMMSQANAPAEATGNAARTAGPSASYAGRIIGRVFPNIIFTGNLASNPAADVEVTLGPDGTIRTKRLVHSSGIAEWDEAVLKAIDRTAVLPRDVDGSVPPSLTISIRPHLVP